MEKASKIKNSNINLETHFVELNCINIYIATYGAKKHTKI
jgi:hypothetical protein